MKALTLILALIISAPCWSAGKISFETLYRFSVMTRLRDAIPAGKCIDLKEHFIKSLSWIGPNVSRENWRNKSRSFRDAKIFCSTEKENPLCQDLREYFSLVDQKRFLDKNKKKLNISFGELDDDKLLGHNLRTVSREDLISDSFLKERLSGNREYTNEFSCAENREVDTALKYRDVLGAVAWEGDSSISSKMLYKFESVLEMAYDEKNKRLDFSEFDEMNDDCKATAMESQRLLLKQFKESFVSQCMEGFRKAGFSIYDKKQMYCSGKTPLACRLSQNSRKTASEN